MRRLDERVEKPTVRGGYGHPSFSSTLLDSICRSIDDDKPTRGAPDSRWAPLKKPAPAAVTRPRAHFQTTTSSSSENSSYGFSSSEPESVPVQPNRLRPVRTEKIRPATLPPPPPTEKKKKKPSIRSQIRELRKSRSPTSPAARLAGFLNSLFKPKSGAGSGEVKKPMTSSAATCNGSDRSVRFQLPVDGRKTTTPPPPPPPAKVMTWQRFGEEDDVASDSSSDLFELENLTGNGRYLNELPVYESTNLGRLIL